MLKRVISILFLTTMQIAQSMEIESTSRSVDTLHEDFKKADIAELPDDQINTYFLGLCPLNYQVVNTVTTLQTRATKRMQRKSVKTVFSSGSDESEKGITDNNSDHNSERTPTPEGNAFDTSLEMLVPSLEQTLPDLEHDIAFDQKRNILSFLQSTSSYVEANKKLNTLSDTIIKHYGTLRESDYTRKALITSGALLILKEYSSTFSSSRGTFADTGGSLISTLSQIVGGVGLLAFIGYKAYDTWSDMLAATHALEHFKKDIVMWKQEMKKIKQDIQALDTNTQKLDQGMLQVIGVSEKIQQQMPDVVALSDDHATMAGILQDVIKQMKHDQAKIIKLNECILALSQYSNVKEEAKLVVQNNTNIIDKITTVDPFTAATTLSEEEQKIKIVEKYNKPSLLNKLLGKQKPACFEDIPQQWFVDHKEWLTKHGYTVGI